MAIKRSKTWQHPDPLEEWRSWSDKHLQDHEDESGLRILDFTHARLAGVHQDVDTTDSPTFVGLTLSGLTASKGVFTDASKNLTSTGTLAVAQGGTALTALGTANYVLGVNAGASALEYKSIAAGMGISVTPSAGALTIANTGVLTARTISTTSPLSGGGDLSSDRTLSLAGLSAIGSANYVIGVNSGASAWEAKQLVAGASVGITHAAGSITLALAEPGMVVIYGGAAAPTGWLLCDGTSYLRADYSALFAVIGTAFGSADGTHFNVPDLRQRFPRGKGAADTLGATGGAASGTTSVTTADKPIGAGANDATASYHTHTVDTVPPFQNVNFIIKT